MEEVMENIEEVKETVEQPAVENTEKVESDNKDRRSGNKKFDKKKFGKKDDKKRRDDRRPRDEMESRVISRRRVSKSVN